MYRILRPAQDHEILARQRGLLHLNFKSWCQGSALLAHLLPKVESTFVAWVELEATVDVIDVSP